MRCDCIGYHDPSSVRGLVPICCLLLAHWQTTPNVTLTRNPRASAAPSVVQLRHVKFQPQISATTEARWSLHDWLQVDENFRARVSIFHGRGFRSSILIPWALSRKNCPGSERGVVTSLWTNHSTCPHLSAETISRSTRGRRVFRRPAIIVRT
jgi:hypothetical protein